MTIMFITMAL